MAKRGSRNDWQLDLRPAYTMPRTPGAAPNGNGNGNGARPAPGLTADPTGAVGQALAELRSNDAAMLDALAEIRATLEALRSGVEDLAARVGSVETQVAKQAAAAARPPRPVRDTSRALRESSTGTFERRPRRGTLRIAEDEQSG